MTPDDPITELPPEHDLAMGISSALQDATLLRQENVRLKKILGIEKRRGRIPEDAVYSPEDIHLAMPAEPHYDRLGNLRLSLES